MRGDVVIIDVVAAAASLIAARRPGRITGMHEITLAGSPWTSQAVRVQWGVMNDHGQVTECPSEHDAREYQAQHGGGLASRTTTRYTFVRRPSCRS